MYKQLINENVSKTDRIFLMAGPCVVENESITLGIAEELKRISERLGVFLIFKASYRKANRSSKSSFSGIGDQEALAILQKVKDYFQLPVVTDIHAAQEAQMAAQVADVLQIPAFLCRQTDLLEAAGATQKWVNIKKGQFLSADSMKFAADKVVATGNHQVMLTERGSMFGYQDLVVDMRSIPIMQSLGYPVIMDATHSLQQPNQSSGVTGGKPQLIDNIASASIAAGANGLFIETHPRPAEALSDGANMLPLDQLEKLMVKLIKIKEAIR
jgi:2-dehydro-3-deoxyphosphooctonate aldolase (KDO 8-P synthase)